MDLFWVSCFMLFFEILMIRWLSAEIRIFAYFHNLVLLFAFLGIGLGFAAAKRGSFLVVPFAISAGLILILRLDAYTGINNLISGLLSAVSSDYSLWGAPALGRADEMALVIALGAVLSVLLAAAVMAAVTLFFVPFGQIAGRLIGEYPRPLRAYGINLAGSLAGIWLFQALSLASWPPAIWFGVGGLGCMPLVWRKRWPMLGIGLLVGLSVLLLYEVRTPERWNLWSPYQKLTVIPGVAEIAGQTIPYGHVVLTNSHYYMITVDYSPAFIARYPAVFPASEVPYDHYNIPYRFAGKLDNVLVVGSGAGNDVAAALRAGAGRVTAVDIDPRIIDIGREVHPESPYSDRRVTVVNDDARSFFKKSQEKYDLVVFGLLDSHTLSSSYSNVRIDNYVYTTESFEEAKGLLAPGGVMVVIFDVADSDDFIGARIQRMLGEAFRREPIGFTMRHTVRPGILGGGGTGFVAGDQAIIASRLADDARLRSLVEETQSVHQRWATSDIVPADDDWPYLYLAGRGVPFLFLLMFGMLAGFSLLGVRAAFGRLDRVQWRFFFLGAGFLLLEVQNVSKLALLFGTTWTVNAVVISAVLVTILLANAYAARVQVRSLTPYYGALFGSLLLNYVLPTGVFAALPAGPKELLVGAVMGLPFLFAGVIFSTTFSRADDRASALASNLLGAMVGGMLEALSFLFGVKALLIVACVLYALAWSLGRTAIWRFPTRLRA